MEPPQQRFDIYQINGSDLDMRNCSVFAAAAQRKLAHARGLAGFRNFLKWCHLTYASLTTISAILTPRPAANFPAVRGSQVPRRMIVDTFCRDTPHSLAKAVFVILRFARISSIRIVSIVNPFTSRTESFVSLRCYSISNFCFCQDLNGLFRNFSCCSIGYMLCLNI